MQKKSGLTDKEKSFYVYISECLKRKNFKQIEKLMNNSENLDFFIDPRNIPKRIEIISNLLIDCLRFLDLGEVFRILRFVNRYDLLKKDLTDSELVIINELKQNSVLMANLIDLFGKISNSFILYIKKGMPLNLYQYYKEFFTEYTFSYNEGYNVNIILNYLNEYNVYGLSVKLLGKLETFLKLFKKKIVNNNEKFIEFIFANKRHLVSRRNGLKLLEKINFAEDYNFYSLSMITLYGIGPQGFGFTYSTPKGEMIEICSDIKENEAIIIKYKQFLTEQFLLKLKDELKDLNIENVIVDKLNKYLLELLKPQNLINYYKKEEVLQKIKGFIEISMNVNNYENLIEKISKSLSKILRPVKMIDQFKARMDLIADNKLRSEDIAKLTSLKDKSHYDVLRERLFLQYIVKWFYEIYLENEPKFKKTNP